MFLNTMSKVLYPLEYHKEEILRKSWIELEEWRIIPAERNKRHLNIAWEIIWKKDKLIENKLVAKIIRAIWLIVESAITFLRSYSHNAKILAIKRVKEDKISEILTSIKV